ncbi:hypothetical protein LP43_0780 [Methylophaga thiooxydans]|uniref:Uncharacterized protein n=1 Tax=Methylophaga thiooxydans TaxID=392484 RepID=A0A0A0BHN1_9GAMM|nr:ankyrin repeat domain-containing protein [Methylophaga thiooxydans]KGM07172.1 hypothetical protein LP43_0780 [Methylophaga thiooxydans]
MAHIPSLEETLSQIRQSIGLEKHQQEKKFADFDLSIQNNSEIAARIIKQTFKALDLDEAAAMDAFGNLMEWANFQKGLELNVWTGDANQQMVLWHLLAYSYTPALARRLAFWSLDNTQHGLAPIDAGMPGGKFWFLPSPNLGGDKLEMPMTQVINWLLDLLGGNTLDSLKGSLGTKSNLGQDESVVRTLYNWHKKGILPKSSTKIDELLPDDVELNFKGTFSHNPSLSLDESFVAALNFVEARKLNDAEKLQHEIPMTAARLERIFSGNASDEEKEDFIQKIAIRYQIPTISTVKKHLKVARMMQDGYKRLLKFLCPNVAVDCIDPAQNKLLQIISLFEMTYNLTIEAYKTADSEVEQDAWFESKLPPWNMELFVSVLPNRFPEGYLLVADELTRTFTSLAPDSPIPDMFPWNAASLVLISKRQHSTHDQQLDEHERLKTLCDRVRTSSPWRALMKEDNFGVLTQFASQDDTYPKIKEMVLKRLHELAETDRQKVSVNVIELGYLLNNEIKIRPKNIKQRVQDLLDESEKSSVYVQWKAPLLQFRAKHHLFQNNFAAAIKDFKSALEACSERLFGPLHGEIARDGFATELAEYGFIPQNQEKYYRNMMAYMEFPNGPISFEDAAVECEEYFWGTLYQPYPDAKRVHGLSKRQYITIIKETFPMIQQADWNGFRNWLQKKATILRSKSMKDARRNSVLLAWLKMMNSLQQEHPRSRAIAPHQLQAFLKNWRKAINVLIETWPEQAKIADYKGQTPLMLVSSDGDIELTNLLAPLSDIDMQDHIGRTALHSAVTGGCNKCVSAILHFKPAVNDKTTFLEKNTVLHTAVRFGDPKVVSLIVHEFPVLADQVNHDNQTPLDMAKDIHDNHPLWQKFMNEQNCSTGSKIDFAKIISDLSCSPA